jgi:dTDP-4-amino-4,6-dideoxygalactose transaminase
LALPIHPQLTDREVEAVAHAVLTAIHSFSVH